MSYKSVIFLFLFFSSVFGRAKIIPEKELNTIINFLTGLLEGILPETNANQYISELKLLLNGERCKSNIIYTFFSKLKKEEEETQRVIQLILEKKADHLPSQVISDCINEKERKKKSYLRLKRK